MNNEYCLILRNIVIKFNLPEVGRRNILGRRRNLIRLKKVEREENVFNELEYKDGETQTKNNETDRQACQAHDLRY